MQTLFMTGLWALMLQWGMLFFVRRFYAAWPPLTQRLRAGLVLPVIVGGMAIWMWFDPSLCPQAHAASCPVATFAAEFALRMVAMLLLASVLLWVIDRMRHRP